MLRTWFKIVRAGPPCARVVPARARAEESTILKVWPAAVRSVGRAEICVGRAGVEEGGAGMDCVRPPTTATGVGPAARETGMFEMVRAGPPGIKVAVPAMNTEEGPGVKVTPARVMSGGGELESGVFAFGEPRCTGVATT